MSHPKVSDFSCVCSLGGDSMCTVIGTIFSLTTFLSISCNTVSKYPGLC